MAIYTPGVTDYIPEIQPFQPDYNFLNNVLQTKQGMYDQNYSKLNSTYGKLLYSPLSRQDTTQKRDDFFKAIDGDIKRISGMDLSLQQNVDAANKVFDSFFQNKDIFYDMAFTKEHNRQMQIGDAYKNCVNQEDCGGKYWDTGMQALQYRMKEFKNAPLDQAMKMTNIDYTPFINIQEKATKYLGELIGGKGGFGVTTPMGHDPSGRFLVSLTNGKNILAPFSSLLYTQYGQDPDIKRMFQTQSYVERKNFIEQNAPKYGSEDAAEDKWFDLMRDDYTANAKRNMDVQLQKLGSQARYQLLLKTLKDEGSTGDDPLATDVVNSSIVSDLDTRVADLYKQVLDSATNIFQNGASRDTKRSLADSYHSDRLLRNTIGTAVMNSVAMTGTEEWKEDPYVLSDHKFAQDMVKQADSFARQKDLYEFQGDVDIRKAMALGKVKNPDGSYSDLYGNKLPPAGTGDEQGTSASNIDEFGNITNKFTTSTKILNDEYAEFTGGYYSTLKTILDNPNSTPQEKALAQSTLISIFGKYTTEKGSVDGPYIDPVTNDPDFNAADAAANGRDRIPYGNKIVRAGWDIKTNSFRDKNGKKIESSEDFKKYLLDNFSDKDLPDYYQRTKTQMDLNKNIQSHKGYIARPDVQQMSQNIEKNKLVLESTINLFKSNVKNIRRELNTKLGLLDNTPTLTGGITERDASDLFFKSDNTILTKDQFVKSYLTKYKALYAKKPTPSAQIRTAGTEVGIRPVSTISDPIQDASKFYDSLYNKFQKVYNAGIVVTKPSGEKVRLVQSTTPNAITGGGPGGSNAQALTFNFSSQALKSGQTQGAITFINDALFSKNLLGNMGGPVNEIGDIKADEQTTRDIQSAMSQMKASLMSGDKKLNGFGSYLNIALSNQNMNGMKIVLPTDYLQQFLPKDKDTSNWASNLLENGGVFTVYTPKSDAKTSTFIKSHQQGDYDYIANIQPISLTIPGGGNMNIEKVGQDGSVYVNGSIDVLNPDGTQGQPISFTNRYPAETSIDNLVDALQNYMMLNANTIDNYRRGILPANKLSSFTQLSQVKTQLDIRAGDDPTMPSPLELFYNPGLLQDGR